MGIVLRWLILSEYFGINCIRYVYLYVIFMKKKEIKLDLFFNITSHFKIHHVRLTKTKNST